MQQPLVVRTNSQFRKNYQNLKSGDVVACVLNLKPFEEFIFADLLDRGVVLFPSAVAQLATRSKCFQAMKFSEFMVEDTKVIRDRRDLVTAMEEYSKKGVGKVVTKMDRADCGLGINRWRDCEELFCHVNFCATDVWPFVLQPFIEDVTDIRVILIGDRILEAYWRKSSTGFRNNLHFGGDSGPYDLSVKEMALCRNVMNKGKFPYAHIDLMKTPDGRIYLSEISLFGGTKGAEMSCGDCAKLKKAEEERFLDSVCGRSRTDC